MKHAYKDGKIVLAGQFYEKAPYEMANERIGVTVDGLGGLSAYRIADHANNYIESFFALSVAVDGVPLDPYEQKTVELVGRTVTLRTFCGGKTLTVKQFLTKDDNGVFFEIETEKDAALTVTLNCRSAKSQDQMGADFIRGENFLLSASAKGDWLRANDAFYTGANKRIRFLFTFDGEADAHRAAFRDFDRRARETQGEIDSVQIPASARSEEEKALYLAAYFTSLENHKTVGDFRAFAAGCAYIYPLRTYFRDSYFTMLPLYSSRAELVRDEILTLAKGVAPDGTCPSAVKSDYTAFWGDHFDSPSFLMLELFDYVTHTGDTAILDAEVNGKTVLEIADAALRKLSERADKTGLLYKEGDYNKRDWADEVNRNGYVTYVEALYARALSSAARLFAGRDDKRAREYQGTFERVKAAINDILFDEEKGYYVNYKTADFTEDNLSVDTVFTLLFGIADEEKANRVLDNMERILETKNNREQKGGDFGVMCVYPLYKGKTATCNKSMRPYDYHNGSNWCYLTAMYAYAKYLYGRDFRYPLLSCFDYNVAQGHYTLVEYFSPAAETGGALQGWSGDIAFVYEQIGKKNFFE